MLKAEWHISYRERDGPRVIVNVFLVIHRSLSHFKQ